jgi:hypothetical protein
MAQWTGRTISALVLVLMVFDGVLKISKADAVLQGMSQSGFPLWQIEPIGIVALLCGILYAMPRTAVLGAILLTGFLGGATVTELRLEHSTFVVPVLVGILAWGGLYLRNEALRKLIPYTSEQRATRKF